MVASTDPNGPCRYEQWMVEPQHLDRCPADWREPYDIGRVTAPGEVIFPLLRSWMKQGNRFAANRIGTNGLCLFI